MADIEQIEKAIIVASDPGQSAMHQEALQYIQNTLKSSEDSWRIGITFLVDTNANGSRKYQPPVRFYGLRILEDFLDSRFEPLPPETFEQLRQLLMEYVQTEYTHGSAEAGAPYIRNKFSHTLTLFFLATYLEQWPSFFSDFFTLIQSSSSSGGSAYNPHVSLLLFHMVLEISGEVADQLLKAARSFSSQRHQRDGKVRDAVRERDANKINDAVLTIVADSAEKLNESRKVGRDGSRERLEEVIDWGIRTFGSYVGWIDINLTVTPMTIQLLFSLLSDQSLPIRLATSVALLRIVSKGLKEPVDKVQLFKVLSLGQVLEALEDETRRAQAARGSETDEGEESYRESLGRLLNAYGLELTKLVDDANASEDLRREVSTMISEIRPTLLRFLADPYDDTTSTILPLMSTILSTLKKTKRSAPQEITDVTRAFLSSALAAVLQKMKWDEDEPDLDEMDEDDRQAFESMRKGDLRVQLDSILTIDQEMVISAVQRLVLETLEAYQRGTHVNWNDAELAIYLIYIFGEINKSGGKGRTAFCQAPAVAKELRKAQDYSDFPLTAHGEMLMVLIRSGIVAYPNNAVTMQFFESCARYGDFFKVRKECVVPLLEAMVGPRGIHHPDAKIRSRMYYLFYKFIKDDRGEIPAQLVTTLLDGIRDVLVISVDLPELETPEDDLLTEAIKKPGIFDSQLYLFEVVGLLASIRFQNVEEASGLLLSFVQPLLDDLQSNLQAIKSEQDVMQIVKVHHIVMALGDIARGFPDYPDPVPPTYIPPPIPIFRQMTQAIVVSLEAMNVFKPVRDAARFAFARMVATTGAHITDFIPALMSSLLSHFEPSELADFVNFLSQLMHKLTNQISGVLVQLVMPLHARTMEMLSLPITGTDDRVAHNDTKRGYLTFLNNVMANKLHGILLSDENKTQFVPLLENIIGFAEDVSEPSAQRLAFTFLTRCVSTWGQAAASTNGEAQPIESLPGFDTFIYERLIPLAFRVPSNPSFNIKDGQVLLASYEIAGFLQAIGKARGDEAYQFLATVFLPSQGCPQETAIDFATKLRELNTKDFRRYFSEFIRASRSDVS